MKRRSIYIHIPFCKRKCDYCAFVSCCDLSLQEAYFSALRTEIERCDGADVEISSVFLGGGTPSCAENRYVDGLFDSLAAKFSFAEDAEITAEANPESFTADKARCFAANGVNRVSFGLQSVNDDTLKAIGRLHDYKTFLQATERAFAAGISNLNADVIIGLPESAAAFENTVRTVAALPLSHVSAYALEVHENTPLHQKMLRGEVVPCDDEDVLADEYDLCKEVLENHGYRRYEVSNFAKAGKECRHNLQYWMCGEYYGFGVAAHSYLDGVRRAATENIAAYCDGVAVGGGVTSEEFIGKEEAMREYLMLGLRLERGVSESVFAEKFGMKMAEKFQDLPRLLALGVLQKKDGRLFVAPDKFYILNEILSELL